MYILLASIHVLIALCLILLVLVQAGEGADIGAVFGGGSSQTMFGARGPASFLAKTTIVLAGLFLVTSITLTIWSRHTGSVITADLPAHSRPTFPSPAPARHGSARG